MKEIVHKKKVYLACFNGIREGYSESGKQVVTSATFGFLGNPLEQRINDTITSMQSIKENLEKEGYDVSFVINQENKEALKKWMDLAIQDNKEHYRNDDWKFLEEHKAMIDEEIFDFYNANLLT